MRKFQIFRNLPFQEWHTPYTNGGDSKKTERKRFECNCPYGNHANSRFLDYKDPLHLEKILSIKTGSKLLTFSKTYDTEHIAYHELVEIQYCSDTMQLWYKMDGLPDIFPFMPSFDDTKYQGGGHKESLTCTRYFTVIEDATTPFIPIGMVGDKTAYIKVFSYLTGFNIRKAAYFFEKLDKIVIPKNRKINCSKYDHLYRGPA